jgi:hypothetical protein
MIVVIQCAARKRPDAGHLRSSDGRPVIFVADPDNAPAQSGVVYARPDDLREDGKSWRNALLEYNDQREHNPLGLRAAYTLYQNSTYGRLVDKCDVESVYILSAGWGLINAAFLTPYYDITFSPSAAPYMRRRKWDVYRDFCMLPEGCDEEIIFFGGRDHLPLFHSLTETARGRRTVFYNADRAPTLPGCSLKRFETRTRTNWHYECADAFLDRCECG